MAAEDADEQKTRVLERRGAAGERRAGPAGGSPGKITFFCPNGHRIDVPAAWAGKQGPCTKCGAKVTIPRPGAAPAAAETTPRARPEPGIRPAPPPAAEPPVSEPDPQEITFGPPAEAEVTGDEPRGPESEEPNAGEGGDWSFIGGQPAPAASEGFEAGWQAAPGAAGDGENPTAMLVARLWAEREHGGNIELHLEGGSVIRPHWFDAAWSRGTHGLFASQADDGVVTLTAVAWNTVQKIVVRDLKAVPHDMFM